MLIFSKAYFKLKEISDDQIKSLTPEQAGCIGSLGYTFSVDPNDTERKITFLRMAAKAGDAFYQAEYGNDL